MSLKAVFTRVHRTTVLREAFLPGTVKALVVILTYYEVPSDL